MIETQWGRHNKARIWLDEPLPAIFLPRRVIEKHVICSQIVTPWANRAAMEVLIPHGAMTSYGLLGIEIEPNDSSDLILKIGLSQSLDSRFDGSLAEAVDDVRVGLTDEYADSILEGATKAFATNGLGFGGKAHFCCAAQGRVGSNARTFFALSEALILCLMANHNRPAVDRLVEILKIVFKY